MNLKIFFKEINEEYYELEKLNLKRIITGYYEQGNLSMRYLFFGLNTVYLLLIVAGGMICVYRLFSPEKEQRKKHLIWILWMIAFIPINFASRRPIHLLVILSPVMAFFIGKSIIEISKAINKPVIEKVFIAAMLLFFLLSPVRMILTQNEILYQTNRAKEN